MGARIAEIISHRFSILPSVRRLRNCRWRFFCVVGCLASAFAGVDLCATAATVDVITQVSDVHPSFDYGDDSEALLAPVKGGVVFQGCDFFPNPGYSTLYGAELWRAGTSPNSTHLLKDINPGVTWSRPSDFVRLNSGLSLFVAGATGNPSPNSLWVTDGTEAGTHALGAESLGPIVSDGVRVFAKGVRIHPLNEPPKLDIWFVDGTELIPRIIKTFASYSTYENGPKQFILLNGVLLFVAQDNINAASLWRSDGTGPGTYHLAELNPAIYPFSMSHYATLTTNSTRMFFAHDDTVHGLELWSTDGTPQGTGMLKDINPNGGSMPGLWDHYDGGTSYQTTAVIDDKLYFGADDGVHGRELWVSDGTPDGTQFFKDIVPGPTGSDPSCMTVLNGHLLFFATDADHGRELWISDGTPDGTTLLKDINPGAGSSKLSITSEWYRFGAFTQYHGKAYFEADDGVHGPELWCTDGTADGTQREGDLCPSVIMPHYATKFAVSDNRLYFAGVDAVHPTNPDTQLPNNQIWMLEVVGPGDMILAVAPHDRAVTASAGDVTFDVSNEGIGAMAWTASVVSDSPWLTIDSGASGTNAGSIHAVYDANPAQTPRSATIRVSAADATASPTDVTVTQAGILVPVLSVTPGDQTVGFSESSRYIQVTNAQAGTTMSWTAQITSGDAWLSIFSGASGTNSGTIVVSCAGNPTGVPRSGVLKVTAPDALGSPVTIAIIQEANSRPVLAVTPQTRSVSDASGSASFDVANAGFGVLHWTAQVSAGAEWLSIADGASGDDVGSVTVHFDANTGAGARTGIVRISSAAAGGYKEVMVVQESPLAHSDVNDDDAVDAVDVQIIINAALGLALPDGLHVDVNGDGELNALDVQKVINATLGLP